MAFPSTAVNLAEKDLGGEEDVPLRSRYVVDLSRTVGSEYAPVVEDVIRMVCIQFTVQLMLFFGGVSDGVFTADLLCVLLYVVMGVLLYWLIVRSVVSFR